MIRRLADSPQIPHLQHVENQRLVFTALTTLTASYVHDVELLLCHYSTNLSSHSHALELGDFHCVQKTPVYWWIPAREGLGVQECQHRVTQLG